MTDKEIKKYKQFVLYVKRDLWYLPLDVLYFVLEYTLSAIRRKHDGFTTMTDEELQNNFEKIIEEMNKRKAQKED